MMTEHLGFCKGCGKDVYSNQALNPEKIHHPDGTWTMQMWHSICLAQRETQAELPRPMSVAERAKHYRPVRIQQDKSGPALGQHESQQLWNLGTGPSPNLKEVMPMPAQEQDFAGKPQSGEPPSGQSTATSGDLLAAAREVAQGWYDKGFLAREFSTVEELVEHIASAFHPLVERLELRVVSLSNQLAALAGVPEERDRLKAELAELRKEMKAGGEHIGDLDDEIRELRKPMACGHPKACLVRRDPELTGPSVDDVPYCTACEREATRVQEALTQQRMEDEQVYTLVSLHEQQMEDLREHDRDIRERAERLAQHILDHAPGPTDTKLARDLLAAMEKK